MSDETDKGTAGGGAAGGDFARALGLAADAAASRREVPVPGSATGLGGGPGSAQAIAANAALDARKGADEGRTEDAEPVEQLEPVAELARHIRAVFERNARHRRQSGTDDTLGRMQRIAAREYSEREKALIARTRTPEIYVGELDKKRIALSAMMSEIFANAANPPWTLEPTPEPEVPEEVTARALTEVMEPVSQINEAALMLHLARIAAGKAGPEDEPEGMLGPEQVRAAMGAKMDEVRQLQTEEARRAAEGMERLINDQMTEGGFYDALPETLDFLSIYGTAVMFGPLPRMRRRNVYRRSDKGVRTIVSEMRPVLEYGVFSPWDCYPSPGARGVEDGEFVVRRRFAPSELAQWAATKAGDRLYGGWDAEAVNRILARWPQGGLREMLPEDAEREALQGESAETRAEPGYLEGLEFFGTVRGSELLGVGIRRTLDGRRVDESRYYDVDATTIRDIVVCCRIEEPEVGRPLAKAVVFPRSESWWGEGPLHKGEPAQRVMNSCARWICVNMGQGAAPQMVVTDKSRISPETGGYELEPGKVWLCEAPRYGAPSQGAPLQLLQPQSNLGELLAVYKQFKAMDDDLTGVPDYSYGVGSNGAQIRSSSTLAMLTEGSTRVVKYSIRFVDMMVRALVMKTYAWNMLHGRDETVKGDVTCNPSGVMGLILVEQNYNRLMQFLQLTNNAVDMQIVSTLGRATILREIAKMLRLNPDKLVASETALKERQALADLKQRLEAEQQEANVAATRQGMENQAQMMAERGESGNPPINSQRAAEAAGRRQYEAMRAREGAPAGMTPQGRGALRSVLRDPQGRALAAARGAATREARQGGGEAAGGPAA